MNILVVGDTHSQDEFKLKFKDHHQTVFKFSQDLVAADLERAQLVMDFTMDAWPHAALYEAEGNYQLLINSVKTTLLSFTRRFQWPNLKGGFNGLPGLFNRPVMELVAVDDTAVDSLKQLENDLGTKVVIVADRVGMVTPRVLCMIINEAFYTVQEGTAIAEDIDLGMKLGTRYPSGPFEFCQSIGVKHVYELLEALYEDTKEERYKICPQLKQQYLQQI